jgi:hypothetical protein
MAYNPLRVFRLPNTDKDAEHVRRMHDAVKRGRAILKDPMPTTFLGHESQEPFPKEDPDLVYGLDTGGQSPLGGLPQTS